ncbi:MAG: tetratricopeptide repeat protein [Candidatus Kapabacteria bacterium]|nr:tetratricopeptide repeat protein [Candidatus Kapabacteria bacterium]
MQILLTPSPQRHSFSIAIYFFTALMSFPCAIHGQINIASKNIVSEERVLRETSDLLYQKKYQKALQYIDNAIASDSGGAVFKSRVLSLRAAALRALGTSTQAIIDYEKAALAIDATEKSLEPDEQRVLHRTLHTALQGHLNILVENLRGLSSNPTQLSVDDVTKRNAAEANVFRETEKILAREPNSAAALYNHGFALYKQQLYDSAIQYFKRAAELLPALESASAHYYLGLSYFFLQRHNEALEAFSRALVHAPFHAEGYFYRGCTYIRQDRYNLAIKDFRSALQYNATDAASMGILGSLLINAGQKSEGCSRLLKSAELGYLPAVDLLNRYCNKDENGIKIVRLPEVTVEADRNVNYAQRIKNTKQGISVGQRINPILPTMRNLSKNFSLAGTTTLPDGTTLINAANPLGNQPGMLPLQSMINPADCNSGVINTKSFVSLQCLAYFFRQETEPLGSKVIDKLVRRLQQVADELTIAQAAIDNMSASARTDASQASFDKFFGGDVAQIQSLYRDFQSLLVQLQKKIEEHEKVLKEEGKIP